MQLTPYDEYPVRQAAHPFSHIPSTDYSWDDGYYSGVFNPDAGVFLATGMRVNPNPDMVGGYALLNIRGRQFTVRFNRCWRRDHSWGIYAERPLLAPDRRWLPPSQGRGARRALRILTCSPTGRNSGFFHLREDEDGDQPDLNDVFGSPFAGHLSLGWSGELVHLKSGTHQLEFLPGKRQVRRASFVLTDVHDRQWRQRFETPTPPTKDRIIAADAEPAPAPCAGLVLLCVPLVAKRISAETNDGR
jgi:hypothetical protein